MANQHPWNRLQNPEPNKCSGGDALCAQGRRDAVRAEAAALRGDVAAGTPTARAAKAWRAFLAGQKRP
jgi:hypothetical protein